MAVTEHALTAKGAPRHQPGASDASTEMSSPACLKDEGFDHVKVKGVRRRVRSEESSYEIDDLIDRVQSYRRTYLSFLLLQRPTYFLKKRVRIITSSPSLP